MSGTLEKIPSLVADGEVQISAHGYDELAQDGLFVRDLYAGVPEAELLEDYPDFHKGPCVLVLERDRNGNPIHVVWGIPKGASAPAVLVTAYRPDPSRWSDDFRSRKK
jgi:hypothetical protein